MALPEKIPVKISSEAAGYISFAPVNHQELGFGDLVGRILGVTGKKPSRIRDILAAGSIVSGNSRYRWAPVEIDPAELEALLHRFPDDEPERPFDAARCVLIVFRGRRGKFELQPEIASQRRLFKRTNFWDALMKALATEQLQYHHYSYAEHADVYQATISQEILRRLLEQTSLLKYGSIAQELRVLEPGAAELYVKR